MQIQENNTRAKISKMIKKSSLFSLAFAFLLLAAPLGAQKIPGVGYTPPPGTLVYHCFTDGTELVKMCGPGGVTKLNTAIPWSGQGDDSAGYIGRYLGGQASCVGAWICGVGGENACLKSAQELREKFQRGELGDRTKYTGEPTWQECHDYAAPLKDLGNLNAGTDGLRMQPTIPEGCCKNFLPCVVDAGKEPGTKWREQVATPQGGKRTCYMVQPAAPPVDPGPGGGVDPDPDPPPSGGGEDPPPVTKPEPEPKCWMLKLEGGEVELREVACPAPSLAKAVR